MISFACDYLEGCHPAVLEALTRSNLEQHPGYGLDPWCEKAAAMIRERFTCPESAVHFLVGGTQVNAAVIAAILRIYEGVLSADSGHINVHETGAVEASGHKILPLPAKDGKITGDQVRTAVRLQGDWEHTVRPGMVYVSQATETGTVYTREELRDLYDACRACGLPLFVDGARLGTALMSPACDIQPEEMASLCDVFTVGGTKNGALFGEAAVFTDPALAERFRYVMKQRGAMLAKGRLLGVQFAALMEEDLYFTIARHAVDCALRIRRALLDRGIPLAMDGRTNQIFPVFTQLQAENLARDFELEAWETLPDGRRVMRICTSWATTEAAVEALIRRIGTL